MPKDTRLLPDHIGTTANRFELKPGLSQLGGPVSALRKSRVIIITHQVSVK